MRWIGGLSSSQKIFQFSIREVLPGRDQQKYAEFPLSSTGVEFNIDVKFQNSQRLVSNFTSCDFKFDQHSNVKFEIQFENSRLRRI